MASGFARVACSVEGCPRGTTRIENRDEWRWLNTGTNDPGWLCGTHWRRVPRALKERRRAIIRLWRKRLRRARVASFYDLPPGSPARIAIVRSEQVIRAAWARCVRIAAGDAPETEEGLPPGLAEEIERIGL